MHKGYDIPATTLLKKKLSQQYVGPFTVMEKIGRLAYRLNIPAHWRVHPIFSVAQLEASPKDDTDPYQRPRPDHPDTVFVEGNTNTMKFYEIDRLLNKRIIKKGRGVSTQYLARWKGYGPEFDEWLAVSALGNAKKLVKDYERCLAASGSATSTTPPIPVAPDSTPLALSRRRGRPRKAQADANCLVRDSG